MFMFRPVTAAAASPGRDARFAPIQADRCRRKLSGHGDEAGLQRLTSPLMSIASGRVRSRILRSSWLQHARPSLGAGVRSNAAPVRGPRDWRGRSARDLAWSIGSSPPALSRVRWATSVGIVTSKGAASSETVAGPAIRRARIARRVGSESAWKTASRRSAMEPVCSKRTDTLLTVELPLALYMGKLVGKPDQICCLSDAPALKESPPRIPRHTDHPEITNDHESRAHRTSHRF